MPFRSRLQVPPPCPCADDRVDNAYAAAGAAHAQTTQSSPPASADSTFFGGSADRGIVLKSNSDGSSGEFFEIVDNGLSVLLSIAHAMRAVLFANATTATLRPLRSSIDRAQRISIQHQTSELWMRLPVHKLAAAIPHVLANELARSVRKLQRRLQ
jgi:hypothetical protein